MRKIIVVFTLLFIVTGCTLKQNQLSTSQQVFLLQEKSRNTTADSTYLYLKEANKLIESKSIVSDSLQGENHFLLGEYFRNKEKLDSTAFYFHNALSLPMIL